MIIFTLVSHLLIIHITSWSSAVYYINQTYISASTVVLEDGVYWGVGQLEHNQIAEIDEHLLNLTKTKQTNKKQTISSFHNGSSTIQLFWPSFIKPQSHLLMKTATHLCITNRNLHGGLNATETGYKIKLKLVTKSKVYITWVTSVDVELGAFRSCSQTKGRWRVHVNYRYICT